ncbi:MAG: hypothetical protein JXA89_08590 [Anaerolineae bacterium]|nr:hypothetical protein [Anaerolineae bacterium]
MTESNEATNQPGVSREQLAALVEDKYDYTRSRRGQIREAIVLSVEETQIIVDHKLPLLLKVDP